MYTVLCLFLIVGLPSALVLCGLNVLAAPVLVVSLLSVILRERGQLQQISTWLIAGTVALSVLSIVAATIGIHAAMIGMVGIFVVSCVAGRK
jgi:hypothetical protein